MNWTPRYSMFVVGALATLGCRQPPEARDLSSLRRSGDATFLCIGPDRTGAPLANCPQGRRADDLGLTVGNEGYSLHALVTQTSSAEVAVIRVANPDVGGESGGQVVDLDPTSPGVTPLRVGEQPTDIVSTPGGMASFVGIGQVGLEGIYALPTECILPPRDGEPRRDRTTWPACSLSSTPGDMMMLVDEGAADGGDRDFCADAPDESLPRAEDDALCSADLSEEFVSPGKRKLLVALPEEGKLVVLDAQEILTRQPGSYRPCHIEAELALQAEVPDDVLQPLPEDLVGESGSTWVTYQAIGGSYESSPAGMARKGDAILIGDQAAPVIHQVDVTDACNPVEVAPLFATSFDNPSRVVTTSEIAVSPVSPSGARFAYAVDEIGDGRSNVMIFDVSSTADSRAPLLRAGGPLVSSEAVDRIAFPAAIKDVGFALLDRSAIDPTTGVAVSGVHCDPDPSTPADAAGALYRPSSGRTGAGPFVMRGLFGYALLSNGGVAVIDIEDFDAACRRPRSTNSREELDFRGCSGDPDDVDFFTVDGDEGSTATVTDEVSCRMVVPHRPRSLTLMKTSESDGVASPALRSFGRLTQRGRGLSSSRLTAEGKRNPIVLGVDFEAPGGGAVPARVRVGSTLYSPESLGDQLVINPNEAERSSMVLPFYEPRAYPSSEAVSIVYEGRLGATHDTGQLSEAGSDGQAVLSDPNLSFCSTGVQDRRLTRQVAEARFGLTGGAASRFVDRHTDYVQLTNFLYDEDDEYWSEAGGSCGAGIAGANGQGYELCDSLFGEGDEDELAAARDLTVVSARDGSLELTVRRPEALSTEEHLEVLRCCFPAGISYRLRAGHQWVVRGSASGLEHGVTVDPSDANERCVFAQSPLTERLEGRAFEVSSTSCPNDDPEDADSCGVGLRTQDDVVCAYDATRGPVQVGGVASECIFDGLSRRFAVYRGLEASRRDMAFGFEVIGGFRPQIISLTRGSNLVLPVSMVELPTFGALGVIDSQNRGLMVLDLANSHVAQSFF